VILTQQIPEIQVSLIPNIAVSQRKKVTRSSESYELLLSLWDMKSIYLYEEFVILYLARNNGIIGYRIMNRGSNCGTVVDTRLILSIALKISCNAIILCHNHPSGNLKPSKMDLDITKKIKDACKYFDP